MQLPVLYRNRLIPYESVRLDDDIILYCDEEMLITSWKTLHPKAKLSHGFSCYYLDKGFKISRFYNHDNELLYWYCDIINTDYSRKTNTYIFTDLLADVIIYPDGSYHVVDLDELSEAYESGLLNRELMIKALHSLDDLLKMIYSGKFYEITQKLLECENKSV